MLMVKLHFLYLEPVYGVTSLEIKTQWGIPLDLYIALKTVLVTLTAHIYSKHLLKFDDIKKLNDICQQTYKFLQNIFKIVVLSNNFASAHY